MDFKEYTDLKFEAAVSENRAIVAEIRAELNELDALVRSRPSLGWLIGTSLAVIGTVIALFSFGGSQFAGGYAASSAYARQLETYRAEMMAQIEVTSSRIQRNTEQLQRNTEQLQRNTEQLQRNTEQLQRNTEQLQRNTEQLESIEALLIQAIEGKPEAVR